MPPLLGFQPKNLFERKVPQFYESFLLVVASMFLQVQIVRSFVDRGPSPVATFFQLVWETHMKLLYPRIRHWIILQIHKVLDNLVVNATR